RRDGRAGLDRVRLRRRAARSRTRRPRAPARPASLLLEEREVDPRAPPRRNRRARLLGGERVPQLRQPVEGTAVLGRLNWRVAEVVELRPETSQTKTIVFNVSGWPGHRAGQHVDVRLTAEDGYQAGRSSSIASAANGSRLELTVERLEDGEVSPYLTDDLMRGDAIELRGPVGGYFVWN